MTGTHETLHEFLQRYGDKLAANRRETPQPLLDETFLSELEDSVANPPTPEEQARLDCIFDEGMAVHMAEREKCEEYWGCQAEVLLAITATENKYAFILFHAIRDHAAAKLDLETLIRVGVETYCGLEAATELDDAMIEAARLGTECLFQTM